MAIHYNSDAARAEADATVAAIRALGAKAVAFQADLTSAAAMEKLFADTVAAVGRPDIAVNTVGMVIKKPIAEVTEAEFDQSSAVNVKSAFFFLKEAGKEPERQWQDRHHRGPRFWGRSRRSMPPMRG